MTHDLHSNLPPNWISTRLGQIAKIVYGKALRANERTGKGGVAVYGSSGLVGEHDESLHPGPSLIIGRKGSVGTIYYVSKPFWCIDTAFYLEDPNPFVDLEFLAYALNVVDLRRFSITAAIPGISRKDLENIYFSLPPLLEQRRIVEILREAEELRRLRRKANERTHDLLMALFYETFGDPSTNAKGWKTTKLEKVCRKITDGTHQPPPFQETGVPFLFVSNIVSGEINLNTEKYISRQTYDTLMKRCPVEMGDILYSTVGSYGVAVIVDTDIPFAFQRHIAHLKPDKELVHPLFLRTMLNTPYLKSQADRRSRGIAQKTVNLGDIAQFDIYVPPMKLQLQFVEQVVTFQELRKPQKEAQATFEKLYDSFLTRAFTGSLTAQWREEQGEQLHDEAVERDIALGLRGAEPTIGDLEDERVTRAEREEANRQLQQALEQMQSGMASALQPLLTEMFGNVANASMSTLLKSSSQEFDNLRAEMSELFDQQSRTIPEGIVQQLTDIMDELTLLKADALQMSMFQPSTDLTHRVLAWMNRIGRLAEVAQAFSSWKTTYNIFGDNLKMLFDTIVSSPPYFRADMLSRDRKINLIQIEEGLRLLTVLGIVQPVRIRDQDCYRLVNREREHKMPEGLGL